MFEADGEHLGTIRLRRLDPLADAARVHGWVTEERARFWGMGQASVDDVREIYAELDALDSHDAFVIEVDGRAAGVFQTYWAEQDPVGEHYPCRPGDIGLHLLLAPAAEMSSEERFGRSRIITRELVRFVLGMPGCRRVVAEPDVANQRMIALLERHGFVPVDELRLPHKTARLMVLDPRQA